MTPFIELCVSSSLHHTHPPCRHNPHKQNKKRIQRDHRVKQRLDLIHSNMTRLLNIYKDTDGLVALELKEISGLNTYGQFMEKVEELRQSYAKDPNVVSYTFENPNEKQEDSIDHFAFSTLFTPSELSGKLLDLNALYQRFLNLNIFKTFKQQYEITQFDYYAYLSNLDDMITIIPYRLKATANTFTITQYISYLTDLIAYLKDHFSKMNPLVPVAEITEEIDTRFKEIWENDAVAGYFPNASSSYRDDKPYGIALSMAHKDVDVYFAKDNSPKTLKQSLHNTALAASDSSAPADAAASTAVNPLYCVPCAKLFSKQTLFDSHATGKKHIKAVAQMQKGSVGGGSVQGGESDAKIGRAHV